MKGFTEKLRTSLALSLEHRIMASSAELSYYMLFSFFPMLITVNSILALFHINVGDFSFLDRLVPEAVLSFVSEYTEKSFNQSSLWPLFLGTYLTLFSGSQYIASIRDKLRKIYCVSGKAYIYDRLAAVWYSLVMLFLFILTIVFSLAGRQFIDFLALHFNITKLVSALWLTLRFVIIGTVTFFAIAGLFRSVIAERKKPTDYLIGASLVMVLWLVCSAAFSLYIDKAADYSVIYGSIGTVIVLLLWLYLTNLVILFGGVVNYVFRNNA